ncbi:hypothetical protein [Plantactinospora sp. KBS50]|uniref:hypothetical protein n=1 Tax=Plantactinospora sp. KBS50 TaxID=2024580 RepID=UPI000BAAEB7E|nr:hypothetical protein [Plantactinospora sp. KBS50]ASW56675.1 hypothetical protein CIK06_24730 [Plantactinospora sp. KBS50]
MSRTTWLAAALVVAGLTLGGCGDGTPAPAPTRSGGSPVTSVPSATPSGSSGPSEPPVSSPRPKSPPQTVRPPKPPTNPTPGARVTITGTIAPGVEGNCLLLNGYLLVGGPRDVLKPGASVSVDGQVQPDMVTTCQQGTPLVVESARAS